MAAAKQGLTDDPWQTYWPQNTFGLLPIQITRGFGAVYRPEESRRWVHTLLFPSRSSAMIRASSSDWEALSLGSQRVWYRELKSSEVTVRDPPMHSVTFRPVISRWIPPRWLPSCSCTSKNARPSAYKRRQYYHQDLEKGVTEAKEDDSERYIFREYFSGALRRQREPAVNATATRIIRCPLLTWHKILKTVDHSSSLLCGQILWCVVDINQLCWYTNS